MMITQFILVLRAVGRLARAPQRGRKLGSGALHKHIHSELPPCTMPFSALYSPAFFVVIHSPCTVLPTTSHSFRARQGVPLQELPQTITAPVGSSRARSGLNSRDTCLQRDTAHAGHVEVDPRLSCVRQLCGEDL